MAAARELKLPTVRADAARLAEIAVRERHTHLGYLAKLLSAEIDDRTGRRRTRRIAEARFPRIKRLADFSTDAIPGIAATLATLAAGAWIDAGQPLVLLGDSTCSCSMSSDTSSLTLAGLSCCSRSSPNARNEPPSPSEPTCRSANGEPHFPDPRLVAAIVDRVTFNAHILETGTQSCRLATSKTRSRQ